MHEVQIVSAPELDNVGPWLLAILLRADPLVLIVTRKDEVVSELRPDESLMIVRRRVDQMPENLNRRPVIGQPPPAALFFRNILQPRRSADD